MTMTDGPDGGSRNPGNDKQNTRGKPGAYIPGGTPDTCPDDLDRRPSIEKHELPYEPRDEALLERDPDRDVNRVYVDAELIADTRTGEVQLGFRNLCVNERRMLYQADDVYVELLVPDEGHASLEGGWLYGQFITPTQGARDRHPQPVYAILVGDQGMTGAARTTPLGDFALPYNDPGEFELLLEPRKGPTIRVKFTH